MKDFKKCLDDFLNNKTYIMSYRFNYDSAREFNNELISYIKDLQKYKSLYQNEKDKNDTLKRIIKGIKEELEMQDLIDYLKEQINQCPLTENNETDMFYIGKIRAYQQVLSKIEKSDK